MEWLALDAQMYEEQERVRSEQLRVYLDQEFALGNKEPEIETPKVVKIVVTWNVIAILGWVNVALGLIALMPALFGDAKFYHVGGAFGLVVGGVLVSRSGPLRVVEAQDVEN